MRKARKPTVLISLLPLLLLGCNQAPSNDPPPPTVGPQKSPDGLLTATISAEQGKVAIDIKDAAGKVVHHAVTPIAHSGAPYLRWVNDADLLLKSDGGDYNIRHLPDGTWKGQKPEQ